MTSNRGNFHNRVSMSFLLAAYEAGDLTLAAKVNGSMKRDLEQQMRYYRTLGDDMQADQLAMQAAGYLQNKGSLLTPAQEGFAQDILSSYQMIMQLGEWEKQYAGGKSLVFLTRMRVVKLSRLPIPVLRLRILRNYYS